jgi:hypothetical protein
MEIKLIPIAKVKNSRKTPTDDYWEEVISEIELCTLEINMKKFLLHYLINLNLQT